MPGISINNAVLDIDMLVLDKDGTLIDFNEIWGGRMETAAESIVADRGENAQMLEHLYYCVGYDSTLHRALGQGPLATAPIHQLETVVTSALYQWGISWEIASQLVARHFTSRMSALPTTNEIKVRGPVLETLRDLHDKGVRLAVATTDNRTPTEACLKSIGIFDLISIMACGDDKDFPVKPDPATLLWIAQQFDIEINRLAMIGDTSSDLCMARNAGAGYAIGITGGAGDKIELRAEADILIDSLGEIRPS